jgi:hypothetical protein
MNRRRDCENCAHWSELIAKADLTPTLPVVKALCESPHAGLLAGKFTSAHQSCSDWMTKHLPQLRSA